MGVIGDNEFGISANGAVYEFVVIGVCLDEMEKVCGLHINEIRPVDKSLDYGLGQDGRGVLADDFLILVKNFGGYTKLQCPGQEICPDAMVRALRGQGHQKAICIQYYPAHQPWI